MSTVSSNAEMWVVHENQALLFRQRDHQWHQEMALPFNEFLGSAAALSSFTLPDTTVYLNLKIQATPEASGSEPCWVGVAQDPLRLIETQNDGHYRQQLQDIRAMGKVARVICTDKPQHFERGIEMMWVSTQEHHHLKHWVRMQKTGASKFSSHLQLCGALWLKAGSSHQHLRLATLACTAISLFAMHWHTGQQLEKQAHQIEKSILKSQAKAANAPSKVSFELWAEQINKFGRDNRANLQSLSIHWNSQGDVYSFAVLDRDRKRVPKGCTLENPVQVQCLAKAGTP